MSDGVANNISTERLNGKRPRGQPRQRWVNRMKTDLAEISGGTRIEDSEDRWRGVVEAAKVLNGQ